MITRRTLFGLSIAAMAAAGKVKSPDVAKSPGGPAFYDFNLPNIDGAMTPFAQFKGKVVLVVNVASQSSFTPQYAQLESLYEKYKDGGLVVLGFPSNDFAGQEPEPEAAIKAFAQNTYKVSFPLFSKISVRGDEATPLFHYLSHEANSSITGEPHWNFTKFLIDRKGELVARFDPDVSADDPDLLVAVENALKGAANSPSRPEPPANADQRRRARSRE